MEVAELDVQLPSSRRCISISHFYVSPSEATKVDWNLMLRPNTLVCGDPNIHGSWDVEKYDPRSPIP